MVSSDSLRMASRLVGRHLVEIAERIKVRVIPRKYDVIPWIFEWPNRTNVAVLREYKPNYDELSTRLAKAMYRKISLMFIVIGLVWPFFSPVVIHSCNTCNCLVTVDWIQSDRANKVYNHCGFVSPSSPKPPELEVETPTHPLDEH